MKINKNSLIKIKIEEFNERLKKKLDSKIAQIQTGQI